MKLRLELGSVGQWEEKFLIDSFRSPCCTNFFLNSSPKYSFFLILRAYSFISTRLKIFNNSTLLQGEARILDAPRLKNDFYLNIMDWGKNNVLAIALGSELYLWNAENRNVVKLFQATRGDYPTSVAWSEDSRFVSAGFKSSKLQLWDAETSKAVRVSYK